MSYTADTFFANPAYVKKNWVLIDAKDLVLGRLSADVAVMLRGKNKPYYTPFIDCGDNVVIINAAKIKLTGKKAEKNKFFWHTGYPGGIKERTFGQILNSKFPQRLLENAIRRMMPKDSPLARKQMKNLYVYPTSEHRHQAQQPVLLSIKN